MSQAKGSKSRILYDGEITFGSTRATVVAHVLPFVNESLRQSRNLIDSQSIRSARDARAPVRGNSEIGGDITLELDPFMGKLLYHALGTVSTTGSSPYSHTFTVYDLPPGMTIEKQFTDLTTPEYFVYNGCKVNSLRVSLKSEGFIDTSVNIMGSAETVTTTSIDASPTDYSASAVGGAFNAFSATIKEGGAELGIVTELEFTLENNLDGSVFVIDGTGKRYALPEGLAKVSGTMRILFENMTQYNKAINSTETSLEVTLMNGTGDGSAYNEKIMFVIDEMLLAPQSPAVDGPGGVMVELPFTAYYQDGASASIFKVILWNTQTQGDIAH
jgi:hypothetical protein